MELSKAMNRFSPPVLVCALSLVLVEGTVLRAETGAEAWLRYARLDGQATQKYDKLPGAVVALGDSAILGASRDELIRGIRGMLGKTLHIVPKIPREGAIVLGTLAAAQRAIPSLKLPADLRDDGFWLTHVQVHGSDCIVITAANDRGVLYGAFSMLSKIAGDEAITGVDELQRP